MLLLENKSRVVMYKLYAQNSCNTNVVTLKVIVSDVYCKTMHISVTSKSEDRNAD
jgi:hypothetical protein